MELLEHRQSSDIGSSILQNDLAMGACEHPYAGDVSSCRSQASAGGICQDRTADHAHGERMDDGESGSVEVFQPGDTADEPESSIVVAEALRCQVKITTRRSLHLRIANHTTRDVYVRLVGHGERIAGISTGHGRYTLKQGAAAVKDSVPLSPLEPPAEPAAAEHRAVKGEASALSNDLQPRCASTESSNLRPQPLKDEDGFEEEDDAGGTLTISETAYSPCASMLPSPVDDSQGGVDLLFSPIQSPARLLRELHADPDIQAQLEAERARDRVYERTRLAARSPMSGVLTSSLRLLSSNQRVNACVLSVVRFISVVVGVLLVTVPALLLLLESDIDWSFLHEIRQTPEFEQFHYEYYCPLRRWILCRISMAMENLWSD